MEELSKESKKLMKIAELNEKLEKLDKHIRIFDILFCISTPICLASVVGLFHSLSNEEFDKDIYSMLFVISSCFSISSIIDLITSSNEKNSLKALKEYLESEVNLNSNDIKKLKLEPMEDNDGRI